MAKDQPTSRLPRGELARIYLGRKTLWASGRRISPAMVDDSSPAFGAFLRSMLARTPSQFRSYWKQQLFSGGGAPPHMFRTPEQVAEFVMRQPGAIGIVEATFTDDGVKTVEITGSAAR